MKQAQTKILGIIGIAGAPWILIDFINNGLYERFVATSESGVRNFFFMAGWISSVAGLYLLEAMGAKRWQKTIMVIQLILLLFAECWSIFEIIAPESSSVVFYLLNFSWPVAGFFMVVTGIVILKAKRLRGWKRYVPLLAGLWFPESFATYFLFPNHLMSLIASGLYSAIVFSLLGLCLVTHDYQSVQSRMQYKT